MGTEQWDQQSLLEYIDDVLVITDDDGVVTFVSPNAGRVLGWQVKPGSDHITTLFGDPLFDPADLQKQGEIRGLTVMITDAEGQARILSIRVRKGRFEAGTILYVCRDVSDRTQADGDTPAAMANSERTAREFQDYLKRLHEISMTLSQSETEDQLCYRAVVLGREKLGFDHLGILIESRGYPVVMYGVDRFGTVKDKRHVLQDGPHMDRWRMLLEAPVNTVFQEDVELTDFGEVLGRGWHAMYCMRQGEQVIGAVMSDNLLAQKPVRPYELELLALFGSVIAHLVVRKRTEETLRASEKRFRTLLEAAPVGILLVDTQGNIISANHIAEIYFGYSQAEFAHVVLEDLVPDQLRAVHKQHRAGFFAHPKMRPVHMGVGLDLYGMRKDGTQFPLEVALSYLEIDNAVLAIAFVTDITEHRQVERQQLELRVERERIGILGQFIRDAAHEFRTPLSLINTNLYLLDKVTDRSRRQQMIERIQEQTDALTRLIEVMTIMVRLDYQKPDQHVPMNINTVVTAVVTRKKAAVNARKLSLETNVSGQVSLVKGDAADLSLALDCLLDNALHFTAPTGQVTVHTHYNDEHVTVAVSDTGTGMSDAVLERIFERFYRADPARTTRGFGLGLSIVRKIADLHGGEIQVESAPDKGSTFRLILPLHRD